MNAESNSLRYGQYLKLDQLLACQELKSAAQGQPAHDETLFLIIHQVYELWFKQILHDLDSVLEMLGGDCLDDRKIGCCVGRLDRVVKIQQLLVKQLDVLETMTPLDFLDFRNVLGPSSGFQSFQFRLLENKFGLRSSDRMTIGRSYLEEFSASERERLARSEREPSLFEATDRWLNRTPFLCIEGFNFVEIYRQASSAMLAAERARIESYPGLGADERRRRLDLLAGTEAQFACLYDEDAYQRMAAESGRRLSYRATVAALFINLYREEPILQLPFRLLEQVLNLDSNFALWRFRHSSMVQRMLGQKMGTGGSPGHSYLRSSAERYRVFNDLVNVATLLLPRSLLPDPPPALRTKLGFFYSNGGETLTN